MSRCDREGGGSLLLGIGVLGGCVTQVAVIFAYPPGLQLGFGRRVVVEI